MEVCEIKHRTPPIFSFCTMPHTQHHSLQKSIFNIFDVQDLPTTGKKNSNRQLFQPADWRTNPFLFIIYLLCQLYAITNSAIAQISNDTKPMTTATLGAL